MKNFSVSKHAVKALVMHTSGSKDKSWLPLGSQTELNFGNKGEKSQSEKIDQPSGQQPSSQTSLQEFSVNYTAQKIKFSSEVFLSKCNQIRRKMRIWSHLLKKSLMGNFIVCTV